MLVAVCQPPDGPFARLASGGLQRSQTKLIELC